MGNLLVSDRTNSMLKEYDDEDNLIRSIGLSYPPYGLTMMDGLIVVSHWTGSQLYYYNIEGELLKCVNIPYQPYSLTSSKGSLYVSDYVNTSIHEYDKEGIRTWSKNIGFGASGLGCLRDTGFLLGGFGNIVYLYDCEFKFIGFNSIGHVPYGVSVKDNLIYLSNYISNYIDVFTDEFVKVRRISLGYSPRDITVIGG